MADKPHEIALFPLPGVVLFPHTTVPLLVFEPRYRQLMEHVVAHPPSRIGMVAISHPAQDPMPADPPVARIGCAGAVVAAERNDDGTWRILLRGTERFRIVDERLPDDDRLYRLARIETRVELFGPGDTDALKEGRDELLTLLKRLLQRTAPQHAEAFTADHFADASDEQLINVVAQAIELGLHEKQQLLELDRVVERRRILCELIRFRIIELEDATGQGPGTLQ